MQKISSYLYPNRIELLADLAGFTVEYTNVYQRNVKIYNGIDNTIEFDIKNADQKRIDLSTISNIELNVMDASGAALYNSPYPVIPDPIMKGIASVTIPEEDLVNLSNQFLTYSVTAVKNGKDVMLYGDTRFGGAGKIELIGNAMPTFRDETIYKTFTGEIDGQGNVVYHSSAIPATFYESEPTTELSFNVKLTNFTGTIWLQATTHDTISVESFKNSLPSDITAPYIASSSTTGTLELFKNIEINEYKYFRISYQSLLTGTGASFNIIRSGNVYSATLVNGGGGYAVGSVIRILGSALDGADGTNDLLITVTEINTSPLDRITKAVSNFTITGVAVGGSGEYLNKFGTIFTGKVDSITVL